MNLNRWLGLLGVAIAPALAVSACDESVGTKETPAGGAADAGPDADPLALGAELRVKVPETGRVYVKLGATSQVVTPADPKTSKDWDLAFEGVEAYTNSGVSGPGQSSAFGPLDPIVLVDDVAPEVPFLSIDRTGGAFIRWYFYDGPNHALYSRFHVFGVTDGAKKYKVQVLGYYTDRDGAPVSALYQLRWAEVTDTGVGPTQELKGIDGTAGGAQGAPTTPAECLDLGTGQKVALSPDQARASSAWHLCFRREDITVNGELGGPRGVGALDFEQAATPTEKLTDVVNRTPESEKAKFDAVAAKDFAGQTFRGDRVVSAFTGLWTERGVTPPVPRRAAWLVIGADGKSKYLVGFQRFEGATAKTVGDVVLRIKPVK